MNATTAAAAAITVDERTLEASGEEWGVREAPLLTVIIPVYNEAATVEELTKRVLGGPYPGKQVIVVDDGSTDGTSSALARWEGRAGVTVVTHSANLGKGRAIRTALEQARGRYTIVQDADLEYDPADYPRLIEPLRAGWAPVIYGSRYLFRKVERAGALHHPRRGRHDGADAALSRARDDGPWLFRIGVGGLNLLARLLYGVHLTDEATCYKALATGLLREMELSCERFEFCPEVTAKASRLGLGILEVPISYHPRTAARGKKIRLGDGVSAALALWRWRRWAPAAAMAAASSPCGPERTRASSAGATTLRSGEMAMAGV